MTTPTIDKALRELVEATLLYQSCLSCAHFTESTEGCAVAGGSRPPARVIATGCGAYEEKPPF